MFLFSDILGDHRITLGTEMQIDFKESDYYLSYRYLKNKINHDISFYHQAYKTDIYAAFDYSSYQFTLNRNIGLNYLFFLPFSRFDRLEGGLSYNHLIKEESEINTFSGNESTLQYDSYNIFKPHLKYVWDNTRWFYLYPVSGTRSYLKYEIIPKSRLNDYIFETITFDHRTYFELSFVNKISFASRIFMGSSWGKDKRLFGVGGGPWIFSDTNYMVNSSYEDALPFDDFYFMNNFVFPVRGFPMAEKYGRKALLMNYELRFPFLMYYFPSIKFLGQLFGVAFIDMGAAWNDKFPKFRERKNWETNSNSNITDDNIGWIMSYGYGPRFIFLNMAWKLDYARQYNPINGSKSNRFWYLTIGYDF